VKDPFVPVDIFHKRDDPAFIEEFTLLAVPLVRQGDFYTLIKKGKFTEAVGKNIETEIDVLENFMIWFEGDLGPPSPRLSYFIQVLCGHSPAVGLPVHFPIPSHLQLKV